MTVDKTVCQCVLCGLQMRSAELRDGHLIDMGVVVVCSVHEHFNTSRHMLTKTQSKHYYDERVNNNYYALRNKT